MASTSRVSGGHENPLIWSSYPSTSALVKCLRKCFKSFRVFLSSTRLTTILHNLKAEMTEEARHSCFLTADWTFFAGINPVQSWEMYLAQVHQFGSTPSEAIAPEGTSRIRGHDWPRGPWWTPAVSSAWLAEWKWANGGSGIPVSASRVIWWSFGCWLLSPS